MKHMSLLAATVLGVGAYAAGPAVTAPAAIDATMQSGAATPGTSLAAPGNVTPSATAASGTGGAATAVMRPADTIGPAPQPIPPVPPAMPLPPPVTGTAPLSSLAPAPPVLAPITVQPVSDMETEIPGPEAPAPIVIDRP